MEGPDDMLVDDWAAKAKNIQAGQTYRLLDHDFHVAGIVEHGKGARLFVPLQTLQELSGARDKASLFFIKCTRPEHTPAVMEEIRAVFTNYEIRPLADFRSLMTSANVPGLNAFVTSMIVLAVAIGFLVIFLSMYTTVVERTREIGVLKSLGASKGYIVKALLTGAHTVQVVSVLLRHGPHLIAGLLTGLRHWMERHHFQDVGEFRGRLNHQRCRDPGAFERANYIQMLQSWRV